MEQTFAEWYADNTDADYDTVVAEVNRRIVRIFDVGYERGYNWGLKITLGVDNSGSTNIH